MSVTFTLLPKSQSFNEEGAPASFFFNPDESRRLLSAAENVGFDAVVIDEAAGLLANLDLASSAASDTDGLTVIATHWPGVMAPDEAAQQLAAINALSGGRLSVRVPLADLSELSVAATRRGHLARLRQAEEYLMLLKRLWLSDAPFDYEGPFHSLKDAHVAVKDDLARNIAIRMSGRTGASLDVAGRHANIFELEQGSLAEIRAMKSRVVAAARPYGRAGKIAFALPVTVIGPDGRGGREHPACAIGLEDTARAALSLIPFIEEGIGEFMISGLDDPAALARFGNDVLPVIRNSATRMHAEAAPPFATDPQLTWLERSARIRWRGQHTLF